MNVLIVNGRQRYCCKACRKTFMDTINTILYRTQKVMNGLLLLNVCLKAIPCINQQKLWALLRLHGFIGDTSCYQLLNKWILNNLMVSLKWTRLIFYSQKGQRGINDRKPRKRGGKSTLRGISKEQVYVLVARDRTKATISKVTCMGHVVKTKVDGMIGSKLTPNNVLVTDTIILKLLL